MIPPAQRTWSVTRGGSTTTTSSNGPVVVHGRGGSTVVQPGGASVCQQARACCQHFVAQTNANASTCNTVANLPPVAQGTCTTMRNSYRQALSAMNRPLGPCGP